MAIDYKSNTRKTLAQRQLPDKVSRRYTQARAKKFVKLLDTLLADPRLSSSTINLTTCSEHSVCEQVQQVLNDFVKQEWRREPHTCTWGQTANTRVMPKVAIAGHNNYPDHIVWHNDLIIAVEVKLYTGHSSTLQQALGQALIYSQRYGFVIVFIADATPKGLLAQSFLEKEQRQNKEDTAEDILRSQLWAYHNIEIVCRHIVTK